MKTIFKVTLLVCVITLSVQQLSSQTRFNPQLISSVPVTYWSDSLVRINSRFGGFHPLNKRLFTLTTNLISFSDTSVFADISHSDYQLGYQWSAPTNQKINEILHANFFQNHDGYASWAGAFYSAPRDTTRKNLIMGGDSPAFDGGYAMQWDPEATLPRIYAGGKGQLKQAFNGDWVREYPDFYPTIATSVPLTGDTTGACFGFLTKNQGTLRSIGHENFNRIEFPDTAGNASGTVKILGNPVIPTALSYSNIVNWDNTNRSENNGTQWYVAINLRRLDSSDNTTDTTPVLKIKLPYWKFASCDTCPVPLKDYIRFDSVFVFSNSDTLHLYDALGFKGIVDKHLHADSSHPTEFIIRKNMLPAFTANGEKDITVSAFFQLIGDTVTRSDGSQFERPFLRGGPGARKDLIDSLGLEVYLHKGCDVAIDWLRYETPRARSLFRGVYDSLNAPILHCTLSRRTQ